MTVALIIFAVWLVSFGIMLAARWCLEAALALKYPTIGYSPLTWGGMLGWGLVACVPVMPPIALIMYGCIYLRQKYGRGRVGELLRTPVMKRSRA